MAAYVTAGGRPCPTQIPPPPCHACEPVEALPFTITMAFQAIIDVRTREVFAYEALVRGTGGEPAGAILAQVNPDNRYMFDHTCRCTAVALAARLQVPCFISINFLPNAVYQAATCIRATLQAARQHGFELPIVVVHVVGKRHQLDEIEKMPQRAIGMPAIHALALLEHATRVHGLLDFDERQRHAVDQQGDVWPEFVFAIDERQLGDNVPEVVVQVGEVDQADTRASGQSLVKAPPQIITLEVKLDLVEESGYFIAPHSGIDAQDGLLEQLGKNVVARIPVGLLQRQIVVAKPGQMQDRRDLDPRVFVEGRHSQPPTSMSIIQCPPLAGRLTQQAIGCTKTMLRKPV